MSMYQTRCERALGVRIPFATPYLCEFCLNRQEKTRSRVKKSFDPLADMRIAISQKVPQFD